MLRLQFSSMNIVLDYSTISVNDLGNVERPLVALLLFPPCTIILEKNWHVLGMKPLSFSAYLAMQISSKKMELHEIVDGILLDNEVLTL